MRRAVPLRICLIMGIVMIIQFFIPHRYSQDFYTKVLDWNIIIGIFALVLGIQSLFHSEWTKVRRRRSGWGFSVVTIVAVIVVAAIGIWGGIGEGSVFIKIYRNLTMSMQATMFALLGFYMASAAFRAFRARTKEATVLLIAAIIVMFGRVPVGDLVWHKLPDFVEWILMYPSMAVQRGILLGVALGSAATSLKILLGIERGWLGGSK
ncbi:MAG: hypothetical protein HY769_00355 [Candidatus Stahlbacteria bacterium]|nr:hypothetical protein [Candidatus Stahlbacteria bacterium]